MKEGEETPIIKSDLLAPCLGRIVGHEKLLTSFSLDPSQIYLLAGARETIEIRNQASKDGRNGCMVPDCIPI